MLCLVFDHSLAKLASLVKTMLDLFGLLDLRRLHQTNSLELLASLAQTPGLLDMLGLLDFALCSSLTLVFEQILRKLYEKRRIPIQEFTFSMIY